MDDTRAIILGVGGSTFLARHLGITPQVVNNWHERGVPWRWRPAVAKLAQTKGVVVPDDFLITDSKAA